MKSIGVIVIGCGGVGRQLLHHIISCRSLHAKQGVRLRVVGVCDSKSLLIALDVSAMELDDTFLLEVCRIKSSGSSLQTLSNFGECQVYSSPDAMRKVTEIAASLGRSTGLTLVDCSASSETTEVLNQVVDLGCCVVLANKRPLSCSLDNFDRLFSQPRRIRHESTVGAGLPVIASLNRIISSGDPLYRFIGSLSGTLGYVMSELEDGKLFSEVVRAAKSLGYTEPDPRDDLSGMDVARKALILARLLGHRINLDSIKIESLYPTEMGPNVMSVENFLVNGLPLLDENIQERVVKASSNGKALRYVCMIDNSSLTRFVVYLATIIIDTQFTPERLRQYTIQACSKLGCEVGIHEIPKDSALGRLRGSDNVLEIYSRCYKQQPLVIQGAGAGNDTTAAGVLADILDLQDLFS